jgi:predicted transposase/invertase (TIGR01784 family)
VKSDKIFYQIFKDLPEGFFELIGRAPEEARLYRFMSVELKETAFRIDGVFIPRRKTATTRFVEAQFQRDRRFYRRFFAEIFLYLHQYDVHDWQATVIYPSRSVEHEIDAYRELLNTNRVRRVYLDELPKTKVSRPHIDL